MLITQTTHIFYIQFVLTLTPKSTDVELQMAPMLAAANMASTA